jgi:hypothetical protein
MSNLKKIGFEIGVLVKKQGRTFQSSVMIDEKFEVCWEDETPEDLGGISVYNINTYRVSNFYQEHDCENLRDDYPSLFEGYDAPNLGDAQYDTEIKNQ